MNTLLIYTLNSLMVIFLTVTIPETAIYKSYYPFKEEVHICGSYCGPNWCNNMWLAENKCNTTVSLEHHYLTGFSCADACCQIHDRCCGQHDNLHKLCNAEIIDCLSNCSPLSLTCSRNYIPVPAGGIEIAMEIVKDWCCGEICE